MRFTASRYADNADARFPEAASDKHFAIEAAFKRGMGERGMAMSMAS